MFMTLKMSLHILQQMCPSSKCHSVVSHHRKPWSITHADWNVWSFITFPCVVFCIFLLRVPQNLDILSCGPGFGGNLTVLGFSWKAAVLIFISIQNQIAQK